MIIKIMNKLYPGKENYKKRNAIYRKVRSITDGIKCIVIGAYFFVLSIFVLIVMAVIVDC